MKKKYFITIITQVLNGASYIAESIESVINQTYPHVEHVIVDGCSTDGTLDIIKKYAAASPAKVRFISEKDRGTGEAWNKGIKIARGDILGWIGADDKLMPDAVETIVSFFESSPDAFFVYGGLNYIDENGAITRSQETVPFDFKKLLNQSCMIPTPSSFYKKEIFDVVGGFDILGNDYDFFVRAAKRFPIHTVNKILSCYRVHSGSQNSGTNLKLRLMWKREDCFVSRKNGGIFLSGYCQRYYLLACIIWGQSVINALRRFVDKRFNRKQKSRQS